MSDPFAEYEPSKSEIKRQLQKIKTLAVNLAALTPGQMAKIPLAEDVLNAVIELKAIKSNVAKKRQTQYVTKVLAKQVNLSDIEQAYDMLQGEKQQLDAAFHLSEQWRERLLADPKAMTEFMTQYQNVESQTLRHLIQKTQKEQRLANNQGGAKALFRFIKQVIDNHAI
jgi:ribosome-associated protein